MRASRVNGVAPSPTSTFPLSSAPNQEALGAENQVSQEGDAPGAGAYPAQPRAALRPADRPEARARGDGRRPSGAGIPLGGTTARPGGAQEPHPSEYRGAA